ncbi:hypothetical protein FH972_025752 [Carpinus fangiana]|uniref:cAMP-dependent protein kinase regulatory subunit n=1 Tax=Carpinus fangiana TaxID=176857 RepID=A0A5N6L2C1_9ROSI|nr:hypothetical protein FH972_025752 [Carpinus fangiana]
MAESTFPGTNPFAPSRQSGMQTLSEEEDQAPHGSSAANTTDMNTTQQQHAFGSSGFEPLGGGPFGGQVPASSTLPQNYNYNRRTSVSAESMAPAGADDETWVPPVHPKTAEQISRLRKAVSPNFLFSHLEDGQTDQVLDALKEKPVPAKDIKIIEQGDAGDYFYVVEKGTFDIYVNPSGKIESGAQGLGNKVATISSGGSFGELALMYNAPRAATVISTEPSTLWQLDRVTFRRILMDNAFQRRRLYESFLAEVPLLSGLTDYERSKIADALNTQKFEPGATIIQEGDPGESFFLLEEGEAEVFRKGQSEPVASYKRGAYFGELALLDNKPRAASVISKSAVKLATLGKEGFQRLMGPVEDVMRRNDPRAAVPA